MKCTQSMTLIHDAARLLKRGQARRLKVFPVLLLGFSLAGCVSSPKATKPMSKIAKLNERAIAFHERRCLNYASVFTGNCWQVAEAGWTRCPYFGEAPIQRCLSPSHRAA